MRFGIVGCGTIAPTHAAAIKLIEGASLVAVADVSGDRARSLAERFGVPRHYPNPAGLLADPDIDAICVCTPSGTHADLAVDAMRAGKHVLVEKPMDVTTAACDRILKVGLETGRTVGVISQHRFDPATVEVRQMIDSGRLGRLVLITADVKWWRTQAYYDSGDWRGTFALDGGGALMNQGIHTVDLLLHLGGPVSHAWAQVATAAHDRIEVEDVAVATLRFAGGAIGSLVATTAAYDGLPVCVDVFGTGGSARIEGDRLAWARFADGGRTTGEGPAAHASHVAAGGTAAASSSPEWGQSHRAQIIDFIDAVKSGRPPAVDGIAGRAAVKLVRSVYDAARNGQGLPEDAAID